MNIKNNKNCKVTINDEEVEKYTIKPEMADKMFEKLGYKKYDELQSCRYVRYCDIVNGEKEYIIFSKNKKTVRFQYLYTHASKSINMQELQAINKKTSKQIKLEKSRYSILTDDLDHCYICRFQGKEVLRDDLHEVYGAANRKRSILNGLVVPLCRKHHQNEEILSELKVATQRMYEVNHTRDEFIKLIGKSYIK